MSARHLDPIVWAAAYAAEYRGQHEAGRLAGVDALTRHAPACGIDFDRCRELADAAVLALPETEGPCDNCGGAGRVETREDGPEKCHECYGHGSEAMAAAYREVDRARDLLRRARKRLSGEPESAVLLVDIDAFLGAP